MNNEAKIEHVAPFIGGLLSLSRSDSSVELINPSTGCTILKAPVGCSADVDLAVGSAIDAFGDGRWSEMKPSKRSQIMRVFADLVREHSTPLDALDAEEMGKPIGVKFCNATAASELTRFYAESVDKIAGDVYPSDTSTLVVQRRVPRGVVAAIVPWNFPTFNALLKVAPALAAGNSVVLKPSEWSPRSALYLANLAIRAGIPDGAFNIVPGLGSTVGKELALHPGVQMLTFTGSTAVGKQMLEYSGQSNMKVVLTECGGKSPHVVFNDGLDLEPIAERICQSILTNQGQICSVGSRLLVQKPIETQFIRLISRYLKKRKTGDALSPDTTYGPLASKVQLQRVKKYIDLAPSEGARLIEGGSYLNQESGGCFIEPALFSDVDPKSRLAQEEIFGPVLALTTFETESEAIKLANQTAYGLAAYVWTSKLATGMRVSKSIRSSVILNSTTTPGEGAGNAHSHEPFGFSGIGTEGGLAGMESYMGRQLIWVNHG